MLLLLLLLLCLRSKQILSLTLGFSTLAIEFIPNLWVLLPLEKLLAFPCYLIPLPICLEELPG